MNDFFNYLLSKNGLFIFSSAFAIGLGFGYPTALGVIGAVFLLATLDKL